MRTIKLIVIAVIAIMLMLVIAANMEPVDLHLLPGAVGIDRFSLPGVPLSIVIISAVLTGFIVGILMEFIREGKHRATLARKRRELGELREENARLSARLEERGDQVALLAS
ncbi:MAG: LapA family protein [Pseudomonadota bacterium]